MIAERSTIMVAIFATFMLVLGLYGGISNLPQGEQGQGMIISHENLTLIKEDAYTRGHIDGRASILEEQSTIGYRHDDLGVQAENYPSPHPQWREYATCITRNVCEPRPRYSSDLYWSNIHYGTGMQGCYQNETGQDPNDLVLHMTCPEESFEDTIILTGVTMTCEATDMGGNTVKVNC